MSDVSAPPRRAASGMTTVQRVPGSGLRGEAIGFGSDTCCALARLRRLCQVGQPAAPRARPPAAPARVREARSRGRAGRHLARTRSACYGQGRSDGRPRHQHQRRRAPRRARRSPHRVEGEHLTGGPDPDRRARPALAPLRRGGGGRRDRGSRLGRRARDRPAGIGRRRRLRGGCGRRREGRGGGMVDRGGQPGAEGRRPAAGRPKPPGALSPLVSLTGLPAERDQGALGEPGAAARVPVLTYTQPAVDRSRQVSARIGETAVWSGQPGAMSDRLPVDVPDVELSEPSRPVHADPAEDLLVPRVEGLLRYRPHVDPRALVRSDPAPRQRLRPLRPDRVHVVVLPVELDRALARHVEQLPTLVPALLALHALPVRVLVMQNRDRVGRGRRRRGGYRQADRVDPFAAVLGAVVDEAEHELLAGTPAPFEPRQDVRPPHPPDGAGPGAGESRERLALGPPGGGYLVGVEGEDDPPPGEVARRIEEQPLARALVVPALRVVDQRDLRMARGDLARSVGRPLVGDDDVIGPQAHAAEEAVEDPGLVADWRDDDRAQRVLRRASPTCDASQLRDPPARKRSASSGLPSRAYRPAASIACAGMSRRSRNRQAARRVCLCVSVNPVGALHRSYSFRSWLPSRSRSAVDWRSCRLWVTSASGTWWTLLASAICRNRSVSSNGWPNPSSQPDVKRYVERRISAREGTMAARQSTDTNGVSGSSRRSSRSQRPEGTQRGVHGSPPDSIRRP